MVETGYFFSYVTIFPEIYCFSTAEGIKEGGQNHKKNSVFFKKLFSKNDFFILYRFVRRRFYRNILKNRRYTTQTAAAYLILR